MKISTARLKRLIREELFYREFYGGSLLNESAGGLPDEIPIVIIQPGHFGAAHERAFASNPVIAVLNKDSTFTILEKTPTGHRGVSAGTLSVEDPEVYAREISSSSGPVTEEGWHQAGILRLSDLTPESIAKIGAPANRYAAETQASQIDDYVEQAWQLMNADNAVPHLSTIQRDTHGGWAVAKFEDYADRVVGDAMDIDDPMFTAIVRKLLKRAGGNPEAY